MKSKEFFTVIGLSCLAFANVKAATDWSNLETLEGSRAMIAEIFPGVQILKFSSFKRLPNLGKPSPGQAPCPYVYLATVIYTYENQAGYFITVQKGMFVIPTDCFSAEHKELLYKHQFEPGAFYVGADFTAEIMSAQAYDHWLSRARCQGLIEVENSRKQLPCGTARHFRGFL